MPSMCDNLYTCPNCQAQELHTLREYATCAACKRLTGTYVEMTQVPELECGIDQERYSHVDTWYGAATILKQLEACGASAQIQDLSKVIRLECWGSHYETPGPAHCLFVLIGPSISTTFRTEGY